jgi:hypothetical protein
MARRGFVDVVTFRAGGDSNWRMVSAQDRGEYVEAVIAN